MKVRKVTSNNVRKKNIRALVRIPDVESAFYMFLGSEALLECPLRSRYAQIG